MKRPLSARSLSLAVLAAAASACIGNIGDRDPFDSAKGKNPGEHPAVYEPAAPVLPRLTVSQYRSTLIGLLGADIPLTNIEPDTNPHLFYSIGATSTTLSEIGTQLYEESADAVTHFVFADVARRAAFVGCEVAAPGDACVSDFLTRFGRLAFRRPLTGEELSRWVGVATQLAQPDAWEGLRLAVAGIFQSPHFLYRVELGEPDPDKPGRLRLNGYEMASRLAFLIWDTAPDEELLDAAEAGELDDSDGVAAAADKLLGDERARVAIQAFFAQFLDLGRLDTAMRDPATYPLFAPGMLGSMRKEVELLVDGVVTDGGDVRGIFSTHKTFVNSDLAALYGIDAPGSDPSTFVPIELDPAGPRAGLLTLGAFLTMNAHETQTSPTARGKYVRERVLCQTVPPPPPNVNTQLDPPNEEFKTLREQLEEHRKNPACSGCHSFMDPPGFLFEHFDSIGAYRTLLPGDQPVDSSGDLDGKPLADARDLAKLLEQDERVGRCMATQLYRHALGRLETNGEVPAIDALDASFTDVEHDFKKLVVALAKSEAFRSLANPEEEP